MRGAQSRGERPRAASFGGRDSRAAPPRPGAPTTAQPETAPGGGQNAACPGARGKGTTSRMFCIPVQNMTARSKPIPKPAWGTAP